MISQLFLTKANISVQITRWCWIGILRKVTLWLCWHTATVALAGKGSFLHYMNSLDKQCLSQHTLNLHLFQFWNGFTSTHSPPKKTEKWKIIKSFSNERAGKSHSVLHVICGFIALSSSSLRLWKISKKMLSVECRQHAQGEKSCFSITLPRWHD